MKDDFLMRLRDLGATQDEIDTEAEAWGKDPGEDVLLVAMSNENLRAEILAVRAEDDVHHHTEQEAAEDLAKVRRESVLVQAVGHMGGTVSQILEWVGNDLERSIAVEELERSDQGANRVTLLRQLPVGPF